MIPINRLAAVETDIDLASCLMCESHAMQRGHGGSAAGLAGGSGDWLVARQLGLAGGPGGMRHGMGAWWVARSLGGKQVHHGQPYGNPRRVFPHIV